MSIWSSRGDDTIEIPDRDNYSGEIVSAATLMIDLATATGWNDKIRLCVGGERVFLSLDEARRIRDYFTAVIGAIEKEGR